MTTTTATAGRERVRALVAEHEHRYLANGWTPDPGPRAVLDALDGVVLTPAEWGTVAWLAGGDSTARLASILRKARAAGAPGAEAEQDEQLLQVAVVADAWAAGQR